MLSTEREERGREKNEDQISLGRPSSEERGLALAAGQRHVRQGGREEGRPAGCLPIIQIGNAKRTELALRCRVGARLAGLIEMLGTYYIKEMRTHQMVSTRTVG